MPRERGAVLDARFVAMARHARRIDGKALLMQMVRPLPDFFRRSHQSVHQHNRLAGAAAGGEQVGRHSPILPPILPDPAAR